MRIAQIAPLAEAVPPKLYGGTERVVFWLTEELVQMGHEVTLFASATPLPMRDWSPVHKRHCGSIAIARIQCWRMAQC